MKNSGRQVLVYTGKEGKIKIDDAVLLQWTKLNLEHSYEASKITKEKYDSLCKLLNSNDEESVKLAIELIKVL